MPPSAFSITEWWVAAIVSGIVLALALQSLATKRRDKLKLLLPPLGAAAYLVLASARRGYEAETPLALFTATALGLASTRVIFAGYLRRQLERARSGKPMKRATVPQVVLFLLTFAAVVMSMAVLL